MKSGEVSDEIGENGGLKGHAWYSHAGNSVVSECHAYIYIEREVFCRDFYNGRFDFAYSSCGFVSEGQRAIENKYLAQIVFDEKIKKICWLLNTLFHV